MLTGMALTRGQFPHYSPIKTNLHILIEADLIVESAFSAAAWHIYECTSFSNVTQTHGHAHLRKLCCSLCFNDLPNEVSHDT